MSHPIKKAIWALCTVRSKAHLWEDNAVCTRRVAFSERRRRRTRCGELRDRIPAAEFALGERTRFCPLVPGARVVAFSATGEESQRARPKRSTIGSQPV